MTLSKGRILALLVPLVAVGAVYAALETNGVEAKPLTAFAPQGALLAIESPDFASLLHAWNSSAEQKRWLSGGDYSEFSRSRLFSRLGEAQSEFASAAGLAPDTDFLQQVAGSQSLFAWYDIGQLEFLYITRMPEGQAARSPLMQLRDKFEQRRIGDTVFYVRTSASDPAEQGQDATNSAVTVTQRTVAFAVRGDFLLLATREDLLANALDLMQKSNGRSLQNEGWYSSAVGAAGKHPGDLRMTLDLEKIVASPYFRSYWVQQNITELKQYRTALSDLFHEAGTYREERILLPSDPASARSDVDLGPLLNLVPAHRGVYRAESAPSADEVIQQLKQKLLSRGADEFRDPHVAPAADLSTPVSGDASDLESRIDTPLATQPSEAQDFSPLRTLLSEKSPVDMLVFSTAKQGDAAQKDKVFLPIHGAVALASAGTWSDAAMQQALNRALGRGLTVDEGALRWKPHASSEGTWSELDGAQPLVLAVRGGICIVATDEDTLKQLLGASQRNMGDPQPLTIATGVNFSSERPAFDRLVHLLDHTGQSSQSADNGRQMFFSANMSSLGNTFQDLDAESFVQSVTPDHITHQTVTYQLRTR